MWPHVNSLMHLEYVGPGAKLVHSTNRLGELVSKSKAGRRGSKILAERRNPLRYKGYAPPGGIEPPTNRLED